MQSAQNLYCIVIGNVLESIRRCLQITYIESP